LGFALGIHWIGRMESVEVSLVELVLWVWFWCMHLLWGWNWFLFSCKCVNLRV